MITALQKEKLEGVVGIVGKGVAAKFFISVFSCCHKLFFNGTFGSSIDRDVTSMKVDVKGGFVVDAAQIRYQHIVDEYPHIVVASKFISNILPLIISTTIFMHKAGLHRHTKVVVELIAGRIYAIIQLQGAVILYPFIIGTHLFLALEGEKLSRIRIVSIVAVDCWRIVQDKFVGFFIKPPIVLTSIVVVVTLIIDLQQIFYILKGYLARVSYIRIKQIAQRTHFVIFCIINVIIIVRPSKIFRFLIYHRIAIFIQLFGYNFFIWIHISGPAVIPLPITTP